MVGKAGERASEKGGIVREQERRVGGYNQDVVYQSELKKDSVGWDNAEFFQQLGDDRNALGTAQQQLEQVYLLSNIEKGGMLAAAQIARSNGIGIAVRGTGLLAHMGIESGDPTKAQEFKNKTSKEIDLLLSDELEYKDIGSVVHFDPRVGWNAQKGIEDAARAAIPASKHSAMSSHRTSSAHLKPLNDQSDWALKQAHILEYRLKQLRKMPSHVHQFIPPEDSLISWPGWAKVKSRFVQRVNEYLAEDANYRPGGHYADYVRLVGIHIRIQQCPDRTMVGDHDLFGFTDASSHQFLPAVDSRVSAAQAQLQNSSGFQAQHGGIWNWDPPENQRHIKDVIMGAHGPGKDEPLVYFTPSDTMPVTAAFYVKGEPDCVDSVWEYPSDKKWYPYSA